MKDVYMNDKNVYKRVLLVNCHHFFSDSATGITLRSVWKDWPKDSMMFLSEKSNENENIAAEYSRLFLPAYVTPIRNFLLSYKRYSDTRLSNNAEHESAGQSKGVISRIKKDLRQCIVTAMDTPWAYVPRGLMKKIAEFQPQVIYTLGGRVSSLRLSYTLSEKLNIPIVIHYMDNWVEHIQWEANPLLHPYARQVRKWAYKCMERSEKSIAISPKMAEEYEEKFNVPFAVLMNSVGKEFFEITPKSSNVNDGKCFVYAGGLHLERWKSLVEIAQEIKAVSQSGNDRLIIYTSEVNIKRYKQNFQGLPVEFRNAVPHNEVPHILEKADILVHTEVNDENLFGFFKYSISTKIPEYLASGIPMLFYGPREMSLFQYLSDNKAAYLADNKNNLEKCIYDSLNGTERDNIITNAVALANKNHTLEGAQRSLLMTISDSIKTKG